MLWSSLETRIDNWLIFFFLNHYKFCLTPKFVSAAWNITLNLLLNYSDISPPQYPRLGNATDRGGWWAAVQAHKIWLRILLISIDFEELISLTWLMTRLLLFHPIWLVFFVSGFSHSSYQTYSFNQSFSTNKKQAEYMGGEGPQGPALFHLRMDIRSALGERAWWKEVQLQCFTINSRITPYHSFIFICWFGYTYRLQ